METRRTSPDEPPRQISPGAVQNGDECPNFGHPALTLSFKKYKLLQAKKSFAIVNGLLVLKLLELYNGVIYFFRSIPIAFSKFVILE